MRSLTRSRNAFLLAFLALALLAPAAHAAGREALTLWWVVFNNPEACDGACDGTDLGNPAVEPSVLYSSGRVAARNGRATLVGSVYEAKRGYQDEIIAGPGLIDADKAEIHMVVRSHGPRIRAIELEQITQFLDPGCTDLGGPNECRDVQFSIHLPGEDHSRSTVFWFPDLNDGAAVPGASANLFRDSDGLKMVLYTNVK